MKLTGRHAEDVGHGRIVEPGEDIPADADENVVKRLKADGLVSTKGDTAKTKPSKES
jgi:hypothetical protein